MSAADTTTPAKVPPPRQAPPPRGRSPRTHAEPGLPAAATPWLLLAPCLLILALVLGYPLVRLVTLSFQKFGQSQLLGLPAGRLGRVRQLHRRPGRRRVLAVVVRTSSSRPAA